MEGADLKKVMNMLRSKHMEEKFRLLRASTLLSELRSAVSQVQTDGFISGESRGARGPPTARNPMKPPLSVHYNFEEEEGGKGMWEEEEEEEEEESPLWGAIIRPPPATVSKDGMLRLMFHAQSLAGPLRELLETVLHMPVPTTLFRYLGFRSATLRDLRHLLHKFSSLSSYLREELTPQLLRDEHDDSSSSSSHGAHARGRDALQDPMVGRRDLLEKMVRILVSDSDSRSSDGGRRRRLWLMPIVGGPGVGKTRLANAILHSGRARRKFRERRLMVPVTRRFDIRSIKAAMFPIKSVEEVENLLNDESSYIASKLGGGDYLIVLDDVWSDNQGKWMDIANLLRALPPNGTVVLTTRTPDIVPKLATLVETANAARPFYLQHLDKEFSSAFAASCIGACHSDWPPELITEAGMAVAGKCGGVPLLLDYVCGFFCQPLHMPFWQEFLKNTGDMLIHRHLPDVMFWREILSCIEELPHDKFWQWFVGHYPGTPYANNNNAAVLESAFASYNHLPSDLRKCLLYCSMFPSDHDFDVEELADLLVAEGYIPSVVAQAQRRGFLKQLLDECFYPLQQHEYGGSSRTIHRMHQVLHIFAQNKDKGFGTVLRVNQETFTSIRRASLIVNPSTQRFPRGLFACNNIGALILLQEGEGATYPPDQPRCQITEIPQEFSKSFQSIRALSFRATKIRSLPTKLLERYQQVKYLNLSHTDIKNIPSSIPRLYLLQTLILSYCDKLQKLHWNILKLTLLQKLDLQGCCSLVELPPDMSRMKSLEYLNFAECSSLTVLPRGMGQLKSLQMLLGYKVGVPNNTINIGGSLSELQPLADLHRLSLHSLEKVSDLSDVRCAGLQHKTRLESLSLRWSVDDFNNDETAYEVLEYLQPHRRLKALEIVAYHGKKLPSWMTHTWKATSEPYLKSLVEVKLINLRSCELPPLGLLPCLKIAEISGAESVCSVNNSFYGQPNGTFPSLEKLTFSYMHNLEVWEQQADRTDMFPRLAELTIIQCPKLLALHMELPSLEKLTLWMDNRVLDGLKGALRGVGRNLEQVSVSFNERLIDSSDCQGLQDLCNLRKLEICGCDELTCLPQGLQHVSSIRSLTIDNCSKLQTLPHWLETKLPSLEIVRLSGCPLLHFIPRGLEQRPGIIVYVEDCPNLIEDPHPNLSAQSSGEPVGARVNKGKEIVQD